MPIVPMIHTLSLTLFVCLTHPWRFQLFVTLDPPTLVQGFRAWLVFPFVKTEILVVPAS